MSRCLRVVPLLVPAACFGVAIACSNSNSGPAGGDGGNSASSSSSGSSSSSSGASGGPSDASHDAADAGPGLLVDNMTAATGTQISLQVPAGDMPGSYYTYGDQLGSIFSSNKQLQDVPVAPDAGISQSDGTTIVGELCFDGSVFQYAGLGMNLVYGPNPQADAGVLSMPVPFDASAYSGVSFYVLFDASDAASPTLRFSIPDTQTADPAAFATSACNFDGGSCDDDFGRPVMPTPGEWTKVSFKFDELTQVGFGTTFTAIKKDQLIGMKWQVDGPKGDLEPFQFCISNIYFTP